MALAAVLGVMLAVSFAAGAATSPWWSVSVPFGLSVAFQLLGGGEFNPLMFVVTFGPWAAGVLVRSRRRMNRQLLVIGVQIEAEEARYAAEQLRLERVRLARELHDTVAHWLTAVIVQAAAGQVLAETDLEMAGHALEDIGEAVWHAHREVERAVALSASQDAAHADLGLVHGLIAGTATAGITVSVPRSGCNGLPYDLAATAFRVVQEGITNAWRHAPGAAIEILVNPSDRGLDVEVVNCAPERAASGLELSGAGLGLTGLRERAEAIGGRFEAGPTRYGGWRLAVSLPS